jgi:hypothetical protein
MKEKQLQNIENKLTNKTNKMKKLLFTTAMALLLFSCNNGAKTNTNLLIGKWVSNFSDISGDTKLTIIFLENAGYQKHMETKMAAIKNPVHLEYTGTYTLSADLKTVNTIWGMDNTTYKSEEHIDSLSENTLVLTEAKLNKTITFTRVK